MPLSANTNPYYDDYNQDKQYQRVMFVPGRPVQARELTQLQTITQKQIERLGKHIFNHGARILDGQVAYGKCKYIKVADYEMNDSNEDQIDVDRVYSSDSILGAKLVLDSTSAGNYKLDSDGRMITPDGRSPIGQVIFAVGREASDPPTILLSYESGDEFAANDYIKSVITAQFPDQFRAVINTTSSSSISGATGNSSYAGIANGVYFINSSTGGYFSYVPKQRIILNKYTNTPTYKVGLQITESFVTEVEDETLFDNAGGVGQITAPGAHRLKIALNLAIAPNSDGITIDPDSATDFVELLRLENGQKAYGSTNDSSEVYSILGDALARRTYDESGNYVVDEFDCRIEEATNPPGDQLKVIVQPIKGKSAAKAYIRGREYKQATPWIQTINKARNTAIIKDLASPTRIGGYIFVQNIKSQAVAGIQYLQPGRMPLMDLHSVNSYSVNTNSLVAYNTTKVGSFRVRDIKTAGGANTYALWTTDFKGSPALTGSFSATAVSVSEYGAKQVKLQYANTSWYDNAYLGSRITITESAAHPKYAGQTRTIIGYTGATHVVTLDQPFLQPTANTLFPGQGEKYSLVVEIAAASTGNGCIVNSGHQDFASAVDGSVFVLSDKSSNAEIAKTSLTTNTNIFQGGTTGILLFPLETGPSRVANSIDSSVTSRDIVFVARYEDSVAASGVTATFAASNFRNYAASYAGAEFITSNSKDYVVINDTTGVVLDSADYTISTFAPNQVTITATTTQIANAQTIRVICPVRVVGLGAKTKLLHRGKNTATVPYTITTDRTMAGNGHIVFSVPNKISGEKDNLGIVDVFRIREIYDTGSLSLAPTGAMLQSDSYKVTQNYTLEDGQREDLYDYASVILKPGSAAPKGQLLVVADYFEHQDNEGSGYFTVDSYKGQIDILDIPSFVSQKSGYKYNLKDYIDFRPSREVDTISITSANTSYYVPFRHVPTASAGSDYIMQVDGNGVFLYDMQYFAPRFDKVILGVRKTASGANTGMMQIVSGTDDRSPALMPRIDQDDLVLFTLSVPSYTFNPNDISIMKENNRRFTMKDIGNISSRVERLEYYSSLNMLEQDLANIKIYDNTGQIERFKNGFLIDTFDSGTAVADVGFAGIPNLDFQAAIGRGVLRPAVEQENVPLVLNDSESTNIVFADGAAFLSYTTVADDSYLQQIRATNNGEENINPFHIQMFQGELKLSPKSDSWKSMIDAPVKRIDTTGSKAAFDTFTQTLNDRMGAILTQWGDWEDDWFGVEKVDVSYMAKDPTGAYERVIRNPPPINPAVLRYIQGGGSIWNPTTGYEYETGGQNELYVRPSDGTILSPYKNWDVAGVNWLKLGVKVHGNDPNFTVPSQTRVMDDELQKTVTSQNVHQSRRGTYQTFQVTEDQIEVNNFVVNTNVAQFMRPVDIKFRGTTLKPNTTVYPLFDSVSVINYTERANELTLSHQTGSTAYSNPFRVNPDDEEILISSSGGYGIAVGAEGNTVFLVSSNGTFNVGDTITGSKTTPAPVKVVVKYKHYAGQIMSSSSITLTLDDSAKKSWFNTSSGTRATNDNAGSPGVDLYGRQVYITEGRGYGQSRTVTQYSNTTSILTVSPAWDLTPNTQSRYSLGEFKTNSQGSVFGVFHVPNFNWANHTVEEYVEGDTIFSGNTWQSSLGQSRERTLDEQRFLTGTKIFSLRDTTNIFDNQVLTHAEQAFRASGIIETRQRYVQDVYGIGIETANIQDSRVITNRSEESHETGNFIETGQVISWFDPLAQSFLVDPHKYPEGIFIDSVDIWFKRKHDISGGTDLPVSCEIRTTTGGVPSASEIITRKSISANGVNVSSGAIGDLPSVSNEASITNFKFDRPVYLSGGAEYAIVLRTDSTEYEAWTAKIGDSKVGTGDGTGIPAQIVDSQPHLGYMFKSQNGSTWQSEANQDLMFRFHRCKFTPGVLGTAIWKSANVMSQPTASFARVADQFNHPNWSGSRPPLGTYWSNPYSHKLWQKDFVFDNFRVDTSQLEYPSSNIIFDYDCVKENESLVPNVFDLDFDINDGYKTIQLNQDSAHPSSRLKILKDLSGSFVLRGKMSTENENITPVINLERLGVTLFKNLIDDGNLHANTWPRSYVMMDNYSGGNTVGGGFIINNPGSGYLNADTLIFTTAAGKVGFGATGKLITNGGGSIVGVTLTNAGNTYLHAPTITITTGTGTGGSLSYVGENSPNGPGNFQARYVTKKVVLAPGFNSKDLRVLLTAAQPPGTKVHVYTKVRSQEDSQSFNDKPWQLLSRGQTPDAEGSANEFDYKELTFGGSGADDEYPLSYIVGPDGVPGGGERYMTFNEFAIKIVMQSKTPRIVPIIKDLRSIAIE